MDGWVWKSLYARFLRAPLCGANKSTALLGRGADAKMNLSTFETHLKLSVPSQQTMRLTSSVKIKTPGYDFQDTPAHQHTFSMLIRNIIWSNMVKYKSER